MRERRREGGGEKGTVKIEKESGQARRLLECEGNAAEGLGLGPC